ncbi:MAG: glycoside hydrolase family 3 C-terminal domain-containing protein [Tannerellaceae bacterium]|jgi:beta-glucosidase|nr:glycoside hydrolase family 3 C-terminal domain-containing protein [Tannerellaceae bacterium]
MKCRTSFYLLLASFLTLLAGCRQSYEYPFLDPTLSPSERAEDIVSRLTLEEKVSQMLNSTPAIERLGVPPYDWWNECLHGAGVSCHDYTPTVYPQAIGLAAGWDTAAVKLMASYTSDEVRAIYNTAQAKQDYRIFRGLTCWSPNINIFRDPRWGRGQETYGEDPFLTASMGRNFVAGLQGDDPHYLKVAACAKHYAVHSGPEAKRHVFNAEINDYDLWDTYLPAFRSLVVDAKVAGVMCAYNAYEGKPCCGSDKLLIDILRNTWNFNGYVTSDCGAINDFYNNHKTHPDAPSAAADAVIHGTDVDCGQEAYMGLIQAVKDGKITEAQIDVSLRRLFEIRFRLGMFDPKERVPFSQIDSTNLDNPEHKALALKMAQQAIVMLKNDGTLPLKKEGIKKIALVGPNVDRPEVQLGNYNGYPKKSYTPLDGLRSKLPDVEIVHVQGCDYTNPGYIVNLDMDKYITSPDGQGEGFKVTFYNNTALQGEPIYTGYSKSINYERRNDENNPIAQGVNLNDHSGRFEGIFTSPISGEIEMKFQFDDGYRFYIDGKIVCEDFNRHTMDNYTYIMKAEKGRKYNLKVEYVQHEGGSRIILEAYQHFIRTTAEFLSQVNDADIIIFVGGISPRIEGEESSVELPGFYRGDRTSIMLPQIQADLVKALKTTGKPVILTLMTGSAIALQPEVQNVNAIVNTWYGGEFAGNALADVLFGDCNPSGHLPVTFYASDKDLPDFEDYKMGNRTYKYFSGKTQYPFGFGLSYTNFSYQWDAKPETAFTADGVINCSVNITNTGTVAGDAVPQVYVKYPGGYKLPVRQLVAFDRKHLAPGETYRMDIFIPVVDLAKWNMGRKAFALAQGSYTIYAGSHAEDEAAIATFELR